MSNAAVRDELVALTARVDAGDITPEEAAGAFERLTFQLTGVDQADDARLRDWVNDIERIRLTLLAANQKQAVAAVLRDARSLFDRLA